MIKDLRNIIWQQFMINTIIIKLASLNMLKSIYCDNILALKAHIEKSMKLNQTLWKLDQKKLVETDGPTEIKSTKKTEIDYDALNNFTANNAVVRRIKKNRPLMLNTDAELYNINKKAIENSEDKKPDEPKRKIKPKNLKEKMLLSRKNVRKTIK